MGLLTIYIKTNQPTCQYTSETCIASLVSQNSEEEKMLRFCILFSCDMSIRTEPAV